MKTYDITILSEDARHDDCLGDGWCFGLPPGIQPYQWPLDPGNGYPLAHGFTISIPDEYRCKGQEFVAFSFFGTPEDMDIGEGGPFIDEDIVSMFEIEAPKPDDADLMLFWSSDRQSHPHLYRLGGGDIMPYAVILLTQSEYEGPLCLPPRIVPNTYRDRIQPPAWLDAGSAWAAVQTANDDKLLNIFGKQPERDLEFNRALRLEVRLDDPNVGKPPRSRQSTEQTGYEIGYYDCPDGQHRLHEWASRNSWMHFGGTMRPGQGIPDFSPYYLEFEQYLGGFNFGDGTAQLDLDSMRFNIMVL